VVLEGEAFVAYVPFFARYPYEVYLAPKAHQASLLDLGGTDFGELALVLKGLLMKYDALFDRPFPYMMVCHQAPTDGAVHPEYHLHFEFYPPMRTATKQKFLAGCESGAGNFINDKLAEESAAELRAVGPLTVEAVRQAESGRASQG
jgi:UDPglucose--hexose-1-phosphate uridylyltransferase